jgi:hypothetical protein
VQKTLFRMLAPVGELLGYRPEYPYSDQGEEPFGPEGERTPAASGARTGAVVAAAILVVLVPWVLLRRRRTQSRKIRGPLSPYCFLMHRIAQRNCPKRVGGGLQSSLTDHPQALFVLYIPAKFTVGALLESLFGRFRKGCSQKSQELTPTWLVQRSMQWTSFYASVTPPDLAAAV